MTTEIDDDFYQRADTHIHIANDQTEKVGRGKVSASMMYATARFNSWISACKAESGDDLLEGKEKIIEYFVEQYREMLTENLDEYAKNFDKYMSR
jgi:vacuolar-type H+-ATPase subunit E/Vma4